MAERNLVLRVASAVVGMPLVGLIIFWPQRLAFGITCLVAAALALREYGALTLKESSAGQRALLVLVGTGFAAGLYFHPGAALGWLIGAVLALGFSALWGVTDHQAAAGRLAFSVFGVIYVGGLMAALALLHREGPDGPLWLTVAVATTFANDSGAYFAGRTLGRHKLAPAISPGKTVEGGVGGLLAGIGFLFVARATYFPALTVLDVLVVGVAAGFLGPTGDLVESLLKRAVGAKDSGHLIPGHGGILDRVDALLFVGGSVYVYTAFLR